MDRKIASVQRVKEIIPIVGRNVEGNEFVADNVMLARFEHIAWQCVVRKGEVLPGDLAIYFEISSVLPEHPVFEFMRGRRFRLTTARFLKTTLSQGLCMPLFILKEFGYTDEQLVQLAEGDDLTTVIGVTRYEPPSSVVMGGDAAGVFPTHIIPKTDEIRIQSVPEVLEECRTLPMAATVKCDGTSAAFFWKDGELHVCSRNLELKPGGNVYWNIARKYDLANILKGSDYAIQVEIVGPGIQKNRMDLPEVEMRVFSLYSLSLGKYLPHIEMERVCNRYMLPMVPVEALFLTGIGPLGVDELLEMADEYYPGTMNPREGLVFRPLFEEMYSPSLGGRLSFKVISNQYLLRGGE